MAAKRTITFTAPDGQELSVNVGPTRKISAIRILDFLDWDGYEEGYRWAISLHGTVQAALTGPNQSSSWNILPRHVLLIDENDQPTPDGWYAVPR